MTRCLLLSLCACSQEIVYSSAEPWAETPDCPAGSGLAFVTNTYDDTITWLDAESLAPVCTMPVGRLPPEREGPHHGTALPDGSAYFVGLSNVVPGSGTGPHGSHGTGTVDGFLLKYRSSDHTLTGQARLDRSPGDAQVTPDGRYVVQTHFDLLKISEGKSPEEMRANLTITDTETLEVTRVASCIAPHGVAVAPDSGRAWVACWGSDELAAVRLAPPWDVVRYPVGPEPQSPMQPTYGPFALSVGPDGKVWVSCQETAEVRVFDPQTEMWTAAHALGGPPFFGDFLPDGRFVVPTQGDRTVTFVDSAGATTSFALPEDVCPPPYGPHAAVAHPDGAHVAVVCEGDHETPGSGTVLLVATSGVPRLVSSHPVGRYPDDLVFVRSSP